mmetsp:Transcript_5232/g.8104  ORF Transcript_5232/g.8104 Transcript_5232/m.8104 type:complete len:372 (+) Transcript_5232:45-1160(+)
MRPVSKAGHMAVFAFVVPAGHPRLVRHRLSPRCPVFVSSVRMSVHPEAPSSSSSQNDLTEGESEFPTAGVRRRNPNKFYGSNRFYEKFVPSDAARNILEEIVWHKETEIERLRQKEPLDKLQRRYKENPPAAPLNFLESLRTAGSTEGRHRVKPALIAEVKKASPSKGVLREDFNPVEIAQSYYSAGASCLSVLTDEKYFQGSFENMRAIREALPDVPLLCKDFFIYPYQIYLARMNGADAILLLASVLPDRDLQYFIRIGKGFGLTCLVETHSLEEMDRVLALNGVELVGINNRDLKDFNVDLATTESILAARLDIIKEKGIMVVSESGIHGPDDIARVEKAGCSAVLVGESLVTKPDPGAAVTVLYGLT